MSRFPLSDDPNNPRKHQYWPDDMTDVLSVMSPIPNPDIYGDFPADSSYWSDFDSFLVDWELDLRESFSPILGDRIDDLEFNYYLRPPAAGPYIDFIYTLAENIDWIVQKAGGYIGVGGALIAFAKKRRSRLNPEGANAGVRDNRTYFFTTARGIEAMCLYDAFHKVGISEREARFHISTTSRQAWNGSAQHPLPGVTYTIAILLGVKQFIYVVDANGRAFEHFVIENCRIQGLPLPDWLGEREGWDPFKSTDLPSLDLGDAVPD